MKKPRKKRKRPNGCARCYKAGNSLAKCDWSKHTASVLQRRRADLDARDQAA